MHDSLLSGYNGGLEKLGYGVQYQQPQPKRSVLGTAAKGAALVGGAAAATVGAGAVKNALKPKNMKRIGHMASGLNPLNDSVKRPTGRALVHMAKRLVSPKGGYSKKQRKVAA